jgi:site-specific recombinase XerD
LVGAVLGHRQVTTTKRYSHLSDDPVKAVANRTSERIAAMLSAPPVSEAAE